jgi:hypothetical protein
MLFTVEIGGSSDISHVLAAVREVKDVFGARRN